MKNAILINVFNKNVKVFIHCNAPPRPRVTQVRADPAAI